jgi:hypothetical protein
MIIKTNIQSTQVVQTIQLKVTEIFGEESEGERVIRELPLVRHITSYLY